MKKQHFVAYLVALWALSCGYPRSAEAARYHVRTGGTRVEGASTPAVWDLANCYGDLATARAAMAPEDSLLLDGGRFPLGETLDLPRFVGNRALDDNARVTTIELQGNAGWLLPPALAAGDVRGIWMTCASGERDASAIRAVAGSGDRLLRLQGCWFIGLRATSRGGGGAALRLDAADAGLRTEIVDCLFAANVCEGAGGAVSIADGQDVTIKGSTFMQNLSRPTPYGSVGRGGVIDVKSPTTPSRLKLTSCQFDWNAAWGPGGAIAAEDASVELENVRVYHSRSAAYGSTNWSAGAGLFMRRTQSHQEPISLVVRDCVFRSNHGDLSAGTGSGDGGGILVRGDKYGRDVTLTIEDTEFTDNYNDQGGGLYVGRFAEGTVARCRFLENTAHSQGGAAAKGGSTVANRGETVVFSYCEFIGNRCGVDLNGQVSSTFSRGGAVLVRREPRAEFSHCSFSENRAHGTSWTMGDAVAHPAEGGTFNTDAMRCAMNSCIFYGDHGNDVEVRTDPLGFSTVEYCAFLPGEFVAEGVEPTAPIWLDASPFVAPDNLRLVSPSPCIDAAPYRGEDRDLAGEAVPLGTAPEVGAYEYAATTGVDDNAPPAARVELAVQPNPFNPRTRVSFELPSDADAVLALFDARGHRVAILHDGPLAAGSHRFDWNGTDAAGRALPSGVYLARLTAGRLTAAAKLTLVR
jgi:hypothetical protein